MTTLPPALVLTAGRGERLAPLTTVCAKPAVPVAGRPLVVRILDALARQGVPHAVLNLHHRPDSITRVVGHGGPDCPVRYSWEPVLLGSGGGPRRARDLLGPRFLILNGDTLTDVDLAAIHHTHVHRGAAVTLAVMPHPAPDRYGGVVATDDDRVTGFCRAGSPGWHFLGVQIVEARIFDRLPEHRPAATVGGLYDALIDEGRERVVVHRAAADFREVGTPADYLATTLAIAHEETGSDPTPGPGSHIEPGAEVTGSVLWDDVVVEAGARLSSCIVTSGVRVDAHTVAAGEIFHRRGDAVARTPISGAGAPRR